MIEERINKVEIAQARQGEQLAQLSGAVTGISDGVNRLLDRDHKRPQAMTPGSVAAAAGGVATVGAVVWWLIGASPAVQELDRRVTRLDDPEIGRVTRIERDLGWTARVTRAK